MMKILLLLAIFCFLHAKITKNINAYEHIVEIPPEIYKRMCNKGIHAQISPNVNDNHNHRWIFTGVTKSLSDGKYYIYNTEDIIDKIGFYILSWYFLKDI